MNIGDSVRVKDIKIKGVEFLDTPNNVIIAVKTTRIVVEEVKVETPIAGAVVPGATPAVAAASAAAPATGAAPAKAPVKFPAKEDKKK